MEYLSEKVLIALTEDANVIKLFFFRCATLGLASALLTNIESSLKGLPRDKTL